MCERDGSKYLNPELEIITSQRTWELEETVRVYRELAPKRVLEIGTQLGGTLWHWLRNASPGTKVVNIDIFEEISPEGRRILPGMWQSWCPGGVSLVTLEGMSNSPEVIQRVKQELLQIDFLFIDADHTYQGTKFHWEIYGSMVRRGGVVAFHDLITPTFSPHIKVMDCFREIQAAGFATRELYCEAGEAWGGIGLVFV